LRSESETISSIGGLIIVNQFAELIERYEPMVFRTLARLTGKGEGLEDLAQEVFLRLFRALPHFRGTAKVSTFLYRIVVNVANDDWLRRLESQRMAPIDDAALARTHPVSDPEYLLQRAELQQALDTVIGQLPVRDRTILILYYQEERSYKEIVEILELPMGTVKSHLYRAREQLKTAMREWLAPCKMKC